MKLTRRGIVVVGVALLAFVLGANFGARALDAVVVPAIAILVVAVIQVTLTERPEIERSVPEPGFRGESRTMRLHLDTRGIVTITDHLGEGLSPQTVDRTVTGTGAQTEYDVEFVQRGVYDTGPLSVGVRDSLGLVTKQYQYTGFEPLIVYPDIKQLTSPTPLTAVTMAEERIERQEFDQLREYVPSDPLRDVHWKTSAKHQDDLLVVEYTHRGGEGVSVVAEATADHNGNSVDAMATATASVVAHLLDHGIEVSLSVPNGHLEYGCDQKKMLDLLARTRPGRVSTEHVESADVYILGERGRATIEVDGQQTSFGQLIGRETIENTDSDSSGDRETGTKRSVSA